MRQILIRLGAFLTWANLGYAAGVEAAPIHEAAMAGDTQRVQQLLDEGIDVNAADDVGTALQWALFANQIEMVNFLLEAGAEPNVEGPTGTPLQMAVASGNIEIVRPLLEHGADPNIGDRSTPLNAAAMKGSLEIVEMLLAHGADASLPTSDGITALHEAAKRGHLEIARTLVDHGANVNTITAVGKPPIHLAAIGNHTAVVTFLRDQGAAPGTVEPILDLLTSADLDQGKADAEYECSGCHKFERGKNYYGPSLWNVVGRPIGSVGDFDFSQAFTSLGGNWTYDALNGFLARPMEYVPGTKMEVSGIADRQKRANVIAYLRILSDDPLALP
jgi:cytochrome c